MSIEDEIEQLRNELPWVYSNPPHILKVHENEKISIVAADRPDKAVVIGPGGYIAGHLAQRHQKSLSITAYTDELIKTFRKRESERLMKTLQVEGAQKEVLAILKNLLHASPCEKTHTKVAIAISGGRDSVASAVLLNGLF